MKLNLKNQLKKKKGHELSRIVPIAQLKAQSRFFLDWEKYTHTHMHGIELESPVIMATLVMCSSKYRGSSMLAMWFSNKPNSISSSCKNFNSNLTSFSKKKNPASLSIRWRCNYSSIKKIINLRLLFSYGDSIWQHIQIYYI
jgi:hypothetical protein